MLNLRSNPATCCGAYDYVRASFSDKSEDLIEIFFLMCRMACFIPGMNMNNRDAQQVCTKYIVCYLLGVIGTYGVSALFGIMPVGASFIINLLSVSNSMDTDSYYIVQSNLLINYPFPSIQFQICVHPRSFLFQR